MAYTRMTMRKLPRPEWRRRRSRKRKRRRVTGASRPYSVGWTSTDNEHALQLSLGQGADWLSSADGLSTIGRICRPEDVARAILFLLAGAHATGSVLELHPEHIPGMLAAGVGKAK